jgi:hypothetical protein
MWEKYIIHIKLKSDDIYHVSIFDRFIHKYFNTLTQKINSKSMSLDDMDKFTNFFS